MRRDSLISIVRRVQEDGSVTAFSDKPAERLERFNGFWGCFGFRRQIASRLLALMMKSIAKQPIDLKELNASVGAFRLQAYRDLGTWPSVREGLTTPQSCAKTAP
mmetsp:Transcript_52743/g.105649  ORF Transcript_52743/g.105649 Transcript_52743/m.105649 type:complete len:105 (-) Transcript_52743:149-463(-)